MRSGEIRGLQWQDFDPRTGQVAISRTRTHMRTGPPKTLQSARLAAMTFPTLDDTAAWMPTPTSTAVLARVGSIVPLDATFPLFPNSQGRPYDETQLHILWKRALTRAGVRYRKPHACRHSFASIAVSGGDSLYLVGKVLGHRQSPTTERYTHLKDDPVRAIAIRLRVSRAGSRKMTP